LKFITTRNEEGAEEVFVFPKSIDHDAMAEALEGIRNQTHGNWKRSYRKPIAAGFVSEQWGCYGMSQTLDLQSRPEDTELLAKQIA
jgi:hypothetical protein